jgi:hypothetical protein|tara:strand:+ start:6243 stop:6737 length:495 start_codon:yes stop_codon:yes gene_type:complete
MKVFTFSPLPCRMASVKFWARCTSLLSAASISLQACFITEPALSPQPSLIPEQGLEYFVYERLDLASFRNSFGPLRSQSIRYFCDLGIAPTKAAKGLLEIEMSDWYYRVRVINRGDFNRDGLEDLYIEFIDAAKHGSYQRTDLYLITRYHADSDLIAIAFEPAL